MALGDLDASADVSFFIGGIALSDSDEVESIGSYSGIEKNEIKRYYKIILLYNVYYYESAYILLRIGDQFGLFPISLDYPCSILFYQCSITVLFCFLCRD